MSEGFDSNFQPRDEREPRTSPGLLLLYLLLGIAGIAAVFMGVLKVCAGKLCVPHDHEMVAKAIPRAMLVKPVPRVVPVQRPYQVAGM